jgi:hypothetical protein
MRPKIDVMKRVKKLEFEREENNAPIWTGPIT